MTTVNVSSEDELALAKTAMSEVGHFGKYGADVLKGGLEAVVDTILNRVAHPSFPDTVQEVVDAKFQFSAIGGPGGVKTWSRLRPASAAVTKVVHDHLVNRVNGAPSTIKGALHFLNPFFSSSNALRTWGNHVVSHAVAKWGKDRDIHFHGTAPGNVDPPDYTLKYDGKSHDFSGQGASLTGPKKPSQPTKPSELADDAIVGRDEQPHPPLAFRVEQIMLGEIDRLETALNAGSEEGRRLRQIIPMPDRLLVVFEGEDDSEFEQDDDLQEDDKLVVAPSVITPADEFENDFFPVIEKLKLKHFNPREFLFLGAQNEFGPAKGTNFRPPKNLWPNILPTARVLDELRQRLNAPMRLLSIYRSPDYNARIPGAAGGSMHKEFRAADFKCFDGNDSVHWAKQLKLMRDAGVFRGGIGVYPTFVHVDTRGTNANFGPWMNRVFG